MPPTSRSPSTSSGLWRAPGSPACGRRIELREGVADERGGRRDGDRAADACSSSRPSHRSRASSLVMLPPRTGLSQPRACGSRGALLVGAAEQGEVRAGLIAQVPGLVLLGIEQWGGCSDPWRAGTVRRSAAGRPRPGRSGRSRRRRASGPAPGPTVRRVRRTSGAGAAENDRHLRHRASGRWKKHSAPCPGRGSVPRPRVINRLPRTAPTSARGRGTGRQGFTGR